MRIIDTALRLLGATSGEQIIRTAAAASGAITLPAGTMDFSATGGAGQVVKQTTAGGAFTVAQVTAAEVSGALTGNQTITLSGDIAGSGATAITTTLPNVNPNVGTFQGLTLNAKGQVTAAANQSYLTASGVSGMTAGQIPIAATATTITSSGNLSGDVVSTATTLATTIQANAVTTAKINNSAVTYAKIQNVANNRVLGNTSGSAAAPSEITLPLSAANGGTGLAAGTSGGIPYYNTTTTLASSALLTANALIKGGGAGAAPVASTATVDGSGNLTATGALTVSGNANPALAVASGYTNLFAPDATTNNRGVFLGNAASGSSNYYRNSSHDFQDASYNSFGHFDASGLTVGTLISANHQLGSATTDSGTLGFLNTNGPQMVFWGSAAGGANSVTFRGGAFWPSTDNVTSSGNGANGWNTVWSHAYQTMSDPALKRDVEAAPEGALARVMAIAPRRYRMKSDPDEAPLRWGFMAPDIREVMGADFAGWHKDEESGRQSISYNDLTAVLWRALQEAMARIEALEAMIGEPV